MSSRCLEAFVSALLALACGAVQAQAEPLRACADPENLPYSQADGRGFELEVGRLVAQALGRPLQLHWQPLRRGFVRKTLGAGECDLLLGVPKGLERVLTTRPYYRSSYVLVTRAEDPQALQGWDDPRLTALRIGVQLIGNDLAASPPGHVLAHRGAVQHVVGYTADGEPRPAGERMVEAVQRGALDAAFVWGPQAGWFAAQGRPALHVQPMAPPPDVPIPFDFAISLAVPRERADLREQLDAALDRVQPQIDAVLARYAVPVLPPPVQAHRMSQSPQER